MGATLIPAIIGFALLYVCWRYAHSRLMSPRLMAFLAAFTGFFLAFGIPDLLYAATGMAASDTGIGVLIVLNLIGAAVIFFEAVLAHKYHAVGTPFLCGLAGFTFAVTWADWPRVGHYIAKSPHKIAKAMQRETRHVQHAHPATGTVAHQQHTYLVAFVIAVIVLALIVRARYRRREEAVGAPALPQPTLQRGLGIGRLFGKLSRLRKGRKGFVPIGPGGMPDDAPRPPGGGGRRNAGPLPAGRS